MTTKQTTKRVERAAARFAAARVERDDTIKEARAAGLSLREIASASGLAVESVRRVLNGAAS